MTSYSFLLYALLIINVIAKFFTNYLNVIPRQFNLADIGIVGLLLVLYISRPQTSKGIQFKKIFNLLLSFNIILLLGALLNFKYFYDLAAISQVIMFNEPIILFIVLVNLSFSFENVNTFNKLLFFLIMFEVIIGILQVPVYLKTGESESIIGTFQHNAEQYAAFLMIGIFYLIGKVRVISQKKMFNRVLMLGMFILILLIDNKASWIGIIMSVFYVMYRIGKLSSKEGHFLKYSVIFFMFIVIGYSVVQRASGSLYKYEQVLLAWEKGSFFNIGKLKAYGDIFASYSDYPHMTIVGSGPATFYSRASRQFYNLSDDMFYTDTRIFTEQYYKKLYRPSNAMAGVITKTDREPFFKQYFRDRKIFRIGSGTTDEPFSSYAALLGETGILGTLIYLGIYIFILRKLNFYLKKYQNDSKIFPLIVSAIGFLAYIMVISIYSNWIETGRMTTILWSMIAIVCKYDELVQKDEAQAI